MPVEPRAQSVDETVPAEVLDHQDPSRPPAEDDDDDESALLGVLGAFRDLGAAWVGLLIDRPAR